MKFYKAVANGYVIGISTNNGQTEITESEYSEILDIIRTAPVAEEGYAYMLRGDTLEWELVGLPPVPEPEPTADEALARYANELTGENDPDLVSATESLIKHFTEE